MAYHIMSYEYAVYSSSFTAVDKLCPLFGAIGDKFLCNPSQPLVHSRESQRDVLECVFCVFFSGLSTLAIHRRIETGSCLLVNSSKCFVRRIIHKFQPPGCLKGDDRAFNRVWYTPILPRIFIYYRAGNRDQNPTVGYDTPPAFETNSYYCCSRGR